MKYLIFTKIGYTNFGEINDPKQCVQLQEKEICSSEINAKKQN